MTIGLVVVGLMAAAGAAWSGFVLDHAYQPTRPFADPGALTAAGRRSNDLIDWHQRAALACLISALVALGLGVWQAVTGERSIRRQIAIFALLSSAAAGAAVTLATQRLVAWDQVGMWAVTVGTDVRGYRLAATGDQVRFVLIGNAEVSSGRYATVLLIHLAAPVVSAVALAVGGGLLLRRPPARSTPEVEPSDDAWKVAVPR